MVVVVVVVESFGGIVVGVVDVGEEVFGVVVVVESFGVVVVVGIVVAVFGVVVVVIAGRPVHETPRSLSVPVDVKLIKPGWLLVIWLLIHVSYWDTRA